MKKKAAIVTVFRGSTMAMPLCSVEDATDPNKSNLSS
jgi:hypothetical protein|tara:strand:+ start:442 stop:552 length:111 start_codon:yes stop_codon:yes gene_type:complete